MSWKVVVNHSVSVKGLINCQLYLALLALQECKIEVRVPIAGKNYAGVPYGDGHDLYMVRSFVNCVKCRLDDHHLQLFPDVSLSVGLYLGNGILHFCVSGVVLKPCKAGVVES